MNHRTRQSAGPKHRPVCSNGAAVKPALSLKELVEEPGFRVTSHPIRELDFTDTHYIDSTGKLEDELQRTCMWPHMHLPLGKRLFHSVAGHPRRDHDIVDDEETVKA